jgi:hypothetical protein
VVVILLSVKTWLSISPPQEAKTFLESIGGKVEQFVKNKYPANLEIKVSKGEVTLNQKLPYCLKFDESETGIIFDGSENPNINAFETKPKNYPCKPAVIVGKNYVVTTEDGGKINIQKMPTDINFEINQKMLVENTVKYAPIVTASGWKLYLMLPVFLFLIMMPFIMLINFWYSFILGLVAKIFKLGESVELKNKYWIALFFGAILEAINSGLEMAFGYRPNFPFSATILITAAGIIYLKSISKPTGQ